LTLLCAATVTAQQPDTLRLGLGAAIRLAGERNAQVLAAAALVDRAQAGVAVQRSSLLPQLSASLSQSAHTLNTASFGLDFPTAPGEPPLFDPNGQIVGPVRLGDARGSLRQTLLDPAAWARLRGAHAAVEAASTQADAVSERAGAQAGSAYVQALRAGAELAARAADVALAEDLARIAERQLQAGVGVRLDVTRAQAQLATVRAQQVAARNAEERARLALTRALGIGSDVVVVLTDTLPGEEPLPAAAEAIARAAAERPDLKALKAQMRATELQVSAIRAERYPTLSFVGDEGYIGKGWDHLLNTYSWAVQVSVPVFQGFRVRARIAEQEAGLQALSVRERDLEQEVAYQVRAALLDVAGTQEQLVAIRQRLTLADQELAEARERYEAGVSGTADVITASLRLSDARTAYANALGAYAGARVALAAAQGTVMDLR